MKQALTNLLTDPELKLTPTGRLVLFYLERSDDGARIEDIARHTGSKYRWLEATVSKLTRRGILERVGPNRYAITGNREVSG